MSAPTPEQVAAYARALDAGASLLERLLTMLRGDAQTRASRKRRRALRKLQAATRAEARGRLVRAAALRKAARALLAEAEALWPIGAEIAALQAAVDRA